MPRAVSVAPRPRIARRGCEALAGGNQSLLYPQRVRPRFTLKSDNDERCLRMVAAGLGITTAPLSLAIPGVCPINVEGYSLQRRLGVIFSDIIAAETHRKVGEARARSAFWGN
jgi:DNA-binding transcriptional LysR family regulator